MNLQNRPPQGITPATRASAANVFGSRNQGERILIGHNEVYFGGFRFSYSAEDHRIVASDERKNTLKGIELNTEESFAGLMRERQAVFAITRFEAPEGGKETWARHTMVVDANTVKVQSGIEQHAGAFPTSWIPMY
jgi:hypothetical protein